MQLYRVHTFINDVLFSTIVCWYLTLAGTCTTFPLTHFPQPLNPAVTCFDRLSMTTRAI